MTQHEKKLFAVLFAVGDPITPERLALALELDPPTVRGLAEHIRDRLDREKSPLQLLLLQDCYQLATRPEYTPLIRAVLNERRNMPLSPASLEVLATVAYNQPVTRAYVEQVRGVDSSGTVTSLVEKGLLEEAGRLDLPGRPVAFRTTAHFLRTFGLSSLSDLPSAVQEAEEYLPDDPMDELAAALTEVRTDGQTEALATALAEVRIDGQTEVLAAALTEVRIDEATASPANERVEEFTP